MDNFHVFNPLGLCFVIILFVPHIIYKIKAYVKKYHNLPYNKVIGYFEIAGRYTCIFAMIIKLPGLCLNFPSEIWAVIYLDTEGILLIIYCLLWLFSTERFSKKRAVLLSITSFLVFFTSGIFMRYFVLIVASIVYLIMHLIVAKQVYRNME